MESTATSINDKDHDDDDVSVSSTIPEEVDSDEEWPVNKVLTDAKIDGETKYLIEWEGFPLWESTWEPETNLTSETLAEWASEKEAQKNGSSPRFQIKEWKTAVKDHFRAKYLRHEARNRKRRRLDTEETIYPLSFQELERDLGLYPSDNDELSHDQLPVSEDLEEQPHLDNNLDGFSLFSPPEERSASESLPDISDLVSRSQNQAAEQPPASNKRRLKSPPPPQLDTGPPATVRNPTKKVKKPSPFIPSKKLPGSSKGNAIQRTQTAKPTHSAWHFGENVFSRGQAARKRTNLLDAAMSPTAEPRMLKPRLQNIIQQRLRDREGVTDPLQRRNSADASRSMAEQRLEAISLRPDEHNRRNSSEIATTDHSRTSGDPFANHGEEAAQASPQENARAGARKKSVRWDDEPTYQDSMDVDTEESLFVQDGADNDFATAITSTLPMQQVEQAPESVKLRNVRKSVQLGPDVSQTADLVFSGIPEDTNVPWVSSFVLADLLIFSHTCAAQDFNAQDQMRAMRAMHLARGGISSSQSDILEALSGRLRLEISGLLCLRDGYCILVFPSKCEEWKADDSGSDANATEFPLRYGIFKPKEHIVHHWLAPIISPLLPEGPEASLTTQPLQLVKLLGPEYEQLIPPRGQDTKQHHFFLAFPQSADAEGTLVMQWLRDSNPECNILSSVAPGHWMSFMKLGKGTFILHEDAIPAIRRFPGMRNLLNAPGDMFSFWMFTQSQHSTPSVDELASKVGDNQLCQVFESRTAVFLTPSLLVSHPEQAYKLFKRLWSRFKNPSETKREGKLVFCGDAANWILDLAMELARRQGHPSGGGSRPPTRPEAVDSLIKLAMCLRDAAEELCDEPSGCLLSAPSVIDGNDEQSLVNWFGWWSINNLAKFRRFFIVGTSDSGLNRLSRRVRAPKYDGSTSNDPDQIYQEQDGTRQSATATAPSARLVQTDSAKVIRDYLMALTQTMLIVGRHPMVLYRIPVSYWNTNMAFHFSDYSSEFHSFNDWFRFFNPLLPGPSESKKSGPKYNTLAGLFYTIDGKWDLQKYHDGSVPARHPWVALYRPRNPHIRPWRGTQLLIWDLWARQKFPGDEDIYEHDLSEAQRQLVQTVISLTPEKNPNLPLEQIWLGGFETVKSDYVEPLDITLQYLDCLIRDLRHFVPAPDPKLPDRGWKLVLPGCRPEAAASSRKDKEGSSEDEDDVKVICHPPRGQNKTCQSKCRNRLYQHVREARDRGQGDEFEYQFRPTMDWYKEQLAEGRGFEHINVASWEDIFEQYHIDDPEEDLA